MRVIAFRFPSLMIFSFFTLIHLFSLSSALPGSPQRQSDLTDDYLNLANWGSPPSRSQWSGYDSRELVQYPNQFAYQAPHSDRTSESQENLWQNHHFGQPFFPPHSQTGAQQIQYHGYPLNQPPESRIPMTSRRAQLLRDNQMEAERARKDLQEYEMLHQAGISLSTPIIIEPNIVIPPIPVSAPEMLSMTRDEKIVHVYNKIWSGIHAQLTDNLIYRPEFYGKAKASTGKKWDAVYRPERDKLIRRIAKEFFVHCQYVKNLLKASRDNQFSGGMGSNEENGKGGIPEQQSGTSVGESEQGGQQHAQTPSSHRPQGRDRKGKGKKKVSMIDVAEQGSDPGGKMRETQEEAALSNQIQQPEQEYDHMRSFFSPATTKTEFYGTPQQQDSSHMGSFLSLASARGTGLYGDPLNPYQPLYSPQLDYSQNEFVRPKYDDLHPGQWPRSD